MDIVEEIQQPYLYAWGRNKDGELSIGNQKKSNIPKPVQGLKNFQIQSVSSGSNHSALIITDGQLFICGSALHGKLGFEDANQTYYPKFLLVQAMKDYIVTQVATGDQHNVYAWGGTLHKKLGQGAGKPCRVENLAQIQSIGCGDFHSAALSSNGGGGRDYNRGQLGLGHLLDQDTPQIIRDRVIKFSCGGYHMMALDQDGELWSWGSGMYGETGQGEFQNQLVPKKVKILFNQKQIIVDDLYLKQTRFNDLRLQIRWIPILLEHYVFWFQISINNFSFMKILYGYQHLNRIEIDLLFWNQRIIQMIFLFQKGIKRYTINHIHQIIYIISNNLVFMEFHYIWVAQFKQFYCQILVEIPYLYLFRSILFHILLTNNLQNFSLITFSNELFEAKLVHFYKIIIKMQSLSDSIVMLRRPAQKKSYMLPKSPGLDLLGEARQAFLKKIKTFRDHETIEDFMMTLNFVQKLKLQYGPMVVQDQCKTIQYQKISSGQQIIQINKENRTFYVILSGKVSISIMIQKSKRHSVLKQKFKDEMDKINIEKSPQQNSKDLDGVEEQEEYFKLQEIKVLSQGDSFGELALIKENSKATATVTTKTDCEFGVLTRKQYHEVLGKISKNTYYEKLSFLEKVPIFKSWNTEDLKQLSYYLVLKKYQRHEYSFVEGQENSQIFIVKTGTFCLEKKHKNQTILISQLTQQELYMQLPVELKYSFSLKCEQDSSLLYEFSHYDFRKYVEYNNLEDFIQQVKQRSESREERFNQIMIQCNQQLVIDQELKDVKSELNKTIKLYQTLKISSKESKPKNKVVKQQNSSERYQDMAQKALRRNFIIKSQESGDESDSSILPAIRKTSRPQKLWVDLIDAERSFDSLNSYQIGQSEQYNLYYKIKQNSKKQRNAVNS